MPTRIRSEMSFVLLFLTLPTFISEASKFTGPKQKMFFENDIQKKTDRGFFGTSPKTQFKVQLLYSFRVFFLLLTNFETVEQFLFKLITGKSPLNYVFL